MSEDEIEGLETLVDALTAKNKQLEDNYDELNEKYIALKKQPSYNSTHPLHSEDEAEIKFEIELNSLNQQIKQLNQQTSRQEEYIEELELSVSHTENQLKDVTEKCRMRELQIAVLQEEEKSAKSSEAASHDKELEIALLKQELKELEVLNNANNEKIQDLEIANESLRGILEQQDCRNHVDRGLVKSVLQEIEQFSEKMVAEAERTRWKDFLRICSELIY